MRSKRFTLADLVDAEQTNSIFVADLRFAEQKKYLRLPALDLTQVAFDLIEKFHVNSVKTQHQQQTSSSWGYKALATATGKVAYD